MVTRHPRPTTLFTSRTMAKNLLEETLDAWGYARTGVIDELENIPASDFGFRPSPHSRTTAELAAHIIESGLLASGELTHAIAHEEYHRGQLTLYARLLGRVPALTKLIEGG